MLQSYLVTIGYCTTSMTWIEVCNVVRSAYWCKPTQWTSTVDITWSLKRNLLDGRNVLHMITGNPKKDEFVPVINKLSFRFWYLLFYSVYFGLFSQSLALALALVMAVGWLVSQSVHFLVPLFLARALCFGQCTGLWLYIYLCLECVSISVPLSVFSLSLPKSPSLFPSL